MLIFRQLFDLDSSTYTYLLAGAQSRVGVIIDPVLGQVDRDILLINDLQIQIEWVLETHVHADHITGADVLRKKLGAKVALGEGSGVSCTDRLLHDGETMDLGALRLKVMNTPGHTDGCVSYFVATPVPMVFTGDALLIRGCGRTDFQQGSSAKLFSSVREKLFGLPDETLVYPGHDYLGRTCSSIDEEKRCNPRIGLSKTKSEFEHIMANLNLAPPKHIQTAVPANLNCGQI